MSSMAGCEGGLRVAGECDGGVGVGVGEGVG